jgi:hypothetical protein
MILCRKALGLCERMKLRGGTLFGGAIADVSMNEWRWFAGFSASTAATLHHRSEWPKFAFQREECNFTDLVSRPSLELLVRWGCIHNCVRLKETP